MQIQYAVRTPSNRARLHTTLYALFCYHTIHTCLVMLSAIGVSGNSESDTELLLLPPTLLLSLLHALYTTSTKIQRATLCYAVTQDAMS
jgi:hypothetical protein